MIPTLAARVVTQLLADPGASALDLAEALDAPYNEVTEILARLLSEHHVTVVGTQPVARSGMAVLRYEVPHDDCDGEVSDG